ncbi:cell agglutination protein Mam3 [Lecanora helva]
MSTSQPPHAGARLGHTAARPYVFSIAKLLVICLQYTPLADGAPIVNLFPFTVFAEEADPPMSPAKPTLWIYLAVAIALVLLGGAFAGLTIALMGQDEIYLQVIEKSGEDSQRNHAAKVLRLLKRGKHWVLVTLLLGNVITNETLPIVLDRSLGGGWPAVLGSTVLIVIFGEIIPQSICVRYGLPIGAWMSPLVLILMYILGPVAWPTAKLLDRLLGEDHGTTYKKAGLKTLVTLHKSLGEDGEQLNSDEVTIISAVLDLKAKPVGSIMTPMEDTFTLSADTVLDEKTMEYILGAGYSRIPIYAPDNEENFVGMLLVKILITYDPEDGKRVRDFALATLPETRAETSCLDIVNFFQEGKSHMVLVSEYPGEDHGALGVVTLEDVIEELIGEEIIDESDVYIDVHKGLRRIHQAPRSRVPRGAIVTDPDDTISEGQENLINLGEEPKDPRSAMRRNFTHAGRINGMEAGTPPKINHLRRTSSTAQSAGEDKRSKLSFQDHLKNLGPSNPASRPKQTRYNTVKIKPGMGSMSDNLPKTADNTPRPSVAAQGGVGAGLLNSAGKDAKDGVLAVQAGYGSIHSGSPPSPKKSRKGSLVPPSSADGGEEHPRNSLRRDSSMHEDDQGRPKSRSKPPRRSRATSQSTLGSMHSGVRSPLSRNRGTARSGSITEQIVDAGGIKKTVLEMTSSSSDVDHEAEGGSNGSSGGGSGARMRPEGDGENEVGDVDDAKENDKPEGSGGGGKKKRRRKRRHAGSKGSKGGENEETPLLGSGR